jgi:phospholipase/carboxylesterase
MKELDTVEVETGRDPVAAVIWMHGLGADAHDFEPAVPMLALDSERPLRFIFPNAPQRPVTINGGMVMPAWYDLLSFDRDAIEDEAGMRESAAGVEHLISREIDRGLSADRIVLAGFSQGGALALFTGLRQQQTLAGVIALSGYLPLGDIVAKEKQGRPPVFMAHGIIDDVVPVNFGRNSRRKLSQWGYDVRWQEYSMAHTVTAEELADVQSFLAGIL